MAVTLVSTELAGRLSSTCTFTAVLEYVCVEGVDTVDRAVSEVKERSWARRGLSWVGVNLLTLDRLIECCSTSGLRRQEERDIVEELLDGDALAMENEMSGDSTGTAARSSALPRARKSTTVPSSFPMTSTRPKSALSRVWSSFDRFWMGIVFSELDEKGEKEMDGSHRSSEWACVEPLGNSFCKYEQLASTLLSSQVTAHVGQVADLVLLGVTPHSSSAASTCEASSLALFVDTGSASLLIFVGL